MNLATREVTAAAMIGVGRISATRAAKGAAAAIRTAISAATVYQHEDHGYIRTDALLELVQELEGVA